MKAKNTYRLIGRVNGVIGFAESGIHKLSIDEALVGTLDLHPIRLDHRLREGRRRESVVGDMRRKNEDMRGEQEGSEEALTASNSILISPPPSPRLLSTTRHTKSSNL